MEFISEEEEVEEEEMDEESELEFDIEDDVDEISDSVEIELVDLNIVTYDENGDEEENILH